MDGDPQSRCVILFQFCANLNIYMRNEAEIMNNWIHLLVSIILTILILDEN
jgi:hypothetical protein